MSQAQGDAGFYELVFQLAGAQPRADDERRSRRRRRFTGTQMVAPYIDGREPADRDFTAVRFRDISEQGFSYLATQPPECDALVVVLGDAPAATYLTAMVCHCTSVGTPGRPRYLVGCRFTGRIELSAPPPARL